MLPRAVPASLTQRGGDKSRREERGAGSARGHGTASLTLPGARPAPTGMEFPFAWQNHHPTRQDKAGSGQGQGEDVTLSKQRCRPRAAAPGGNSCGISPGLRQQQRQGTEWG